MEKEISSWNILKPLSSLCKQNQLCASKLLSYLPKQIWSQQDRETFLNQLSELLLTVDCVVDICIYFQPLILELANRLLHRNVHEKHSNPDLLKKIAVSISRGFCVSVELQRFAVNFLRRYQPFLQLEISTDGEPCKKKLKKSHINEIDWCSAVWSYLHYLPELSDSLDLLHLTEYLSSRNSLVRWYAALSLSQHLHLSKYERTVFFNKYFTPEDQRLLLLRIENETLTIQKKLLLAKGGLQVEMMVTPQGYSKQNILNTDTSASVVCVMGILLPVVNSQLSDSMTYNPLVLVPSTQHHLQSLALAVSGCRPVMLQGPVGCGKTCLVEHLALMTGRTKAPHILKIQLGDQTDSKSLLGTYCSTEVPGEFVWRAGVLTKAVFEGSWLLLEDVDTAPMDVISLLIALAETGKLSVPGHGDEIRASPGFHLFITRRLLSTADGLYESKSGNCSGLEKLCSVINVEPLSQEELKEVITMKYPALTPVVDKLLDIYFMLSAGRHLITEVNEPGDSSTHGKFISFEGRPISTRDLMTWCSRSTVDFNHMETSQGLRVFLEALDCFVSCLPKKNKRISLATAIGEKLNVSEDRVKYFGTEYKPSLEDSVSCLKIGRASLQKQKPNFQSKPTPTFSYTRSTMVLLEKVAVCIQRNEPVLLCGETGTGKTSTVHFLAHHLGHKLHVINLNQQSDSTDLLGGFKPVDFKFVVKPLREEFERLFCQCFSRAQNEKFLSHIQTLFIKQRWNDLLTLLEAPVNKSLIKYEEGVPEHNAWKKVKNRIHELRLQIREAENILAFSFIEGALVKALTNGDWVLLDEINLATAETLECLSGLLESLSGSVVLTERGDVEGVRRHPDFRLFACMNPATDVGKKELPVGIRNRFTEFFVEELECPKDLNTLVRDYLPGLSLTSKQITGIVNFYLSIKNDPSDKLTDGTGHKPHYSLRTLCRALRFCSRNPCRSVPKSLYEGFCLSFLTQLDRVSHPAVCQLICKHILNNEAAKSVVSQKLPKPDGDDEFINVADYWISKGQLKPFTPAEYILTSSVKLNLKDLSRVVSAGKHPVLLQGDTSVGKTSLIHYLAHVTGNVCVRVNNHEHTDLQEYIGSYAADEQGKLVFKDGVLVEAMRKGYWIILDELNLAPTDVLEALNRLLDDNQELFIPETQEMVHAHPKFILFATQNPPGLYGGRKILSRAFRNRFIELHFDEIPPSELEIILHERCEIPLSYAKKLVSVMLELQTHRRGSGIFFGKHGFMTLRDLFRWAMRYKCPDAGEGEKFYDWDQHLAEHGYMLLAGRVRKAEEESIIKAVLEKHFKRILDVSSLYTVSPSTSGPNKTLLNSVMSQQLFGFQQIVWTYSMRRLAVLIGQAIKFKEPILLVGSTGVGKTTVCQLYAALEGRKLHSINCHMHTESSDFLGGLRPVRSREISEKCDNAKLFEWKDGPLIMAMKEGSMFLIDEISLADDSVLERLNSVLEPERALVLAEKGGNIDLLSTDIEILKAADNFQVFATMNPGGDYGKKELSPALRNRFTEIWCPQLMEHSDLVAIIEKNITSGAHLYDSPDGTSGFGNAIMEFVEWLTSTDMGRRTTVSIRDLINWAYFISKCTSDRKDHLMLDSVTAYIHGACLTFIDSLGTGSSRSSSESQNQSSRFLCLHFLCKQLLSLTGTAVDFVKCGLLLQKPDVDKCLIVTENALTIFPFTISRDAMKYAIDDVFTFDAPTTCINAQKLLRALQLSRPILLEGSPGVGKTTLVAAVAKMACRKFTRINLSEQTDVTDLFGADLPVEGGEAGMFAWRDGPFLQALKAGHWVILDELNLASQSVLEGLNACFDHRGEVYIPELSKTFYIQPDKTRIFACQNPLFQGGGRKGLPQSFLNRFTQVYIDPLTKDDLTFILSTLYPDFPKDMLTAMVNFNAIIIEETMEKKLWALRGSPWDFNLRDLFRWCDLLKYQSVSGFNPGEYMGLIYVDRMRSLADKKKMEEVYTLTLGFRYPLYKSSRKVYLGQTTLQVGHSFLPIRKLSSTSSVILLHHHLEALESLMKCVDMGWLAIILGSQSTGKTSLVKLLAHLTGHSLVILPMNSSMDAIELLGGFEQTDVWRHIGNISLLILQEIKLTQREFLLAEDLKEIFKIESLERLWSEYLHLPSSSEGMSSEEHISVLKQHVQHLQTIVSHLEKLQHKNLDQTFVIGQKLTHLCQIISKMKSGTFEWVDSVLIRALQDGHWLLIDNVNFCSASVLDRLNALLEPNGVLSVNERGTVDEVTVQIVPHPEFRLFFTMDPKHGELSRAMRNRGIEICLLGEDDSCSFSKEDIVSLLHSLGLFCPKLINWLLALHSAMRSELPFGEKPDIADILHAGSLLSQLLGKGFSVTQSSKHVIQDVYISASKYSATKKIAKELALKFLSGLTDDHNEDQSLLPFMKMSVMNDISWFSQVKIASLPLVSALQNVGKSRMVKLEAAATIFIRLQSSESWQLALDWLNVMSVENKNDDGLLVQQCTDRVRHLVSACLPYIFDSLTWKNLQKQLKEIFSSSSKALKLLTEQCWDLNMNPQSCQQALVLCPNDFSKQQLNAVMHHVQRLDMLLYCLHVAFNLKEKLKQLDQSKDKKTCHKVLGLVSVFLTEYVEHLPDIVSNMAQEQFQQLEKSYFQLHYLQHLADATLCNQSLPKDVFLALVGLHWQWVVDKLAYLIPISMSDNSKLYMVTEELKRHLGGGDHMVKQYIKFWNSFGHPKSYPSQMESELAAEINAIRASLSINHVITLENLHSRVHMLAGTPVVHLIWHLAKLMSHPEQVQLVREELNQLKQQMTQIQSADQKTSCNTTDSLKKYPSKLIGLWPFFEYLSLLAEMSLFTEASSVNDKDICQDFIISHTPFIVDFTCETVLNHMWESLACNNYHLWLDWPVEDEQFIVREDSQGPAIFHQATLSKFVMHILTRGSNLATSELFPLHISLGRLEEKRQQLSHISRHLWAHSATLANKHYSINMFEEHLLLATLTRMLLALGCTVLPPMDITTLQKHLSCLQSTVKETQQESIIQLENLFHLHCHNLPEHLKTEILCCLHTYQQFITTEDPEKRATNVYTGLAYVGLTLCELLSPKGPVDPVQKSRIKLGHFQHQVEDIQSELEAWCSYLSDTTGRNLAETPQEHYHPRVVKLIQRQKQLKESISKLEKLIAYRPDPVQFSKVSQVISSFMKNTCSHNKVTELMSKLQLICNSSDTVTSPSFVIEEHVWQDTTSKFIHQLQNTFHCYKDITGPFIQALQTMKLGIRILAHKTERLLKLKKIGSQQSITSAVENLCSFPTVKSNSPDLLHLACHLIKHVTSDLMCNLPQTDVIKSRLLVCALFLIRAHSINFRCINSDVMSTLSSVLDNFTNAWTRQEVQKKLEEAEKSALFKYKDECHGDERSEQEKEEADFKAAYPTFELAFIDVTGADRLEDVGLENQVHHHVTSHNDPLKGITMSEMVKVCSIHIDMMTSISQAAWLDNSSCNIEQETDLMTPSFILYQIGADIVKNVFELLSPESDQSILGSHVLFANLVHQYVASPDEAQERKTSQKNYNIYYDSNVPEVIKCKPVLESLRNRVQELQVEWPDHPTLLLLNQIIERIMTFSVSEPVMKFLTGLELVLLKAQDWESNAASFVSMSVQLGEISQLIVEWRKLELSCWSSSLDREEEKYKEKASHWWFHLYQLTTSYLTSQQIEDGTQSLKDDLITSLKTFMESSTVGEYDLRLNLLLTFHCHILLTKESPVQKQLLNLLWNLYQFYKQYQNQIKDGLKTMRSPIDKKLKGFVKIARWNDMNYWALKASTEKSHRTLHKFIKEYQAVLHQPVKALLGDKTNDLVNSELNMTSEDSLETTVKVISETLKKNLTLDEPEVKSYLVPSSISGITLLPRLQSLFRKLKKHLMMCVEKPKLMKNVLILDEFIGELIEEIHLLQTLQVTANSDKEKQKSEAHSINLRKRKRLSDLFKCLADLGLSYRKGVSKSTRMALAEALDVPPLYVSSSSGLPVKSLLSSCEHYFYRCLSRHAQFTAAVISPSKELGMSEIERCRGFIEHFSQLYVDQRVRVTHLSQECLTLRKYIEAIDTIKDSHYLPPQGQSSNFLARTKYLATQLYQGLSQTSVLLKACPSGPAESVYPSPLAKHKLSPSALWNQGDIEWQQCFDSVQNLLKKVTAEQNNIDKLTRKVVLGRQDMMVLSQTLETFSSFTSQFDKISAQFTDSTGGSSCFTSSLNYLSCEVKQLKLDFTGWWDHLEFNTEPSLETVVVPGLSLRCGKVLSHLSKPEVHYGEKTVEFVQNLDSYVEGVLLCVQNVVSTAQDVSHDEDLQDAHLTKHLVETEISILNKLNLSMRTTKLEELLRSLCCLTETSAVSMSQSHSESVNFCIKSFINCQPLIKSLSILIEGQLVQSVLLHRCMGKLLSVLLAVFTELSQKGFCLPPELSDEKGEEGATEFKDIEGGGLGEGEGVKDVSDQIESEDQLDGVKGMDKDEAEEQKNVPSEDNAIEMSDDFDGKIQDNEETDRVDDEDDRSSQEGDDEEMDQQMGDVDGDNNDKLDDRLWGSDEEDNEAKDDEEGGDGMDRKMEEMVAKDENKEKAKEQDNDRNMEQNADEDNYDDNQVNPHSINEEDKIEELDLPKDLQLEEEDNTLDRAEENMETEQNPEDESVKETDTNDCDDEKNKNDEEKKINEDNKDENSETDGEVPSTNETEEKEESSEEMTNSNVKVEDKEEEKEGDNLPDQEEKPTSEVKDEDMSKPADIDIPVDEEHGADEHAVESSSRLDDQTEVSDVNMEDKEEDETEGVGATSSDDPNGQKGPKSQQKGIDGQEKQSKQEKSVGQSDVDRTLGSREKEHKHLKTSKESRDQKDNVDSKQNKSLEYEHIIKDANSEADAQTVDAATTEQMLEKQAVPTQDKDGDPLEEDENVEVDNDDAEDVNMLDISEKQPAKGKRKEENIGDSDDENNGVENKSVHIDGEKILTITVERPPDSTIHTNIENLHLDSVHQEVDLNLLRSQLEENVHIWSHDPTRHLMQAAVETWQKYHSLTSHLAQELCEQLRLILEPSKATKLKGDYRTGKRLNMRKVIPYIASQFRKDKIWLRRSKPSKRHYQIMIAVDDSASMGDSHSKQLAFESLALVSNALTLLESGELAVCSFGEEMRLLHPFSEPFTNESGARILHLMTCLQKQTKYGMLLDNAVHLIKKAANSVHSTAMNVDTAQLLLILSDGQGVFREGMDFVKRAVRRARSARIFIVFVILDKKGSILDARVPIMDSTGNVQEIKPYLEMFPFPFYIILRDINSMPQILSDALRQWFELVTASD